MKSILRRELGSPLILGLVGSLFIALGSLAVGWLGPGSNVRSWAFIDALRSNVLLVHTATIVVIGASLLLVIAWLKLGVQLRANPPDALRRVIVAAAVWAVPLIVAVPLYSRDLFAYVGQGRLMVGGFNPYLDGISAIQGWFNIGVDPLWASAKTPYGPVYLWIEQIVVGSVGTSPITAVAIFRLIAVLGVAGIAFYAYRIARLRGLDPSQVLWLVLASPIIMFNFIVGGHNDALMLAFLIAGMYYAMIKRPIIATILVTLAIGVKPIALIALPVIGIIWAGQNRTVRSTIKYWVATAAISFVILGVLGFVMNVGFGWVFTLATPGAVAHWYAPVNILAIGLGGAFGAVGLDGEIGANIVKYTAMALMAVIVAWLMLTKRNIDPMMRLSFAFAALVLSSAVIHPWYAAWVIVLFAVSGVRVGLQTHLIVAASIFFACVSIAEGMDVSDAVQGDVGAAILRTVIISGGAIALIVAYCIHEDLSIALLRRRIREARLRFAVSRAAAGAARRATGHPASRSATTLTKP
ncbi:polyprenol phosphomannose-dependent alpha 1,6 mannosyltransferase MptB [Subtercola sp. PAMC28395]|uniref:polyprenol phosphomannose-dependent alpha 1,6 mannosyltransferase MptB n=1 Tax=Subtercola sp. PAMC28395 TaxID=2846775 RepID=UPI001C0BAD62|nr:polyprenol phosphomannose-dependent alpha 1,6 mannosyltransferase MptB [Subtercola sp. PAMC28395]QWT24750.1 polyprenol phosphomannose-dependent alpha 1,6 mannosyltransferase MptB [Subtercola sp. PAMC28395]